MTGNQKSARLPRICLIAALGFLQAGSAAAQDRSAEWPFSIEAAIEEVRRSPFHASHRQGILTLAPGEARAPLSRLPAQTTDPRDRTLSGGNIFFLSLPVAAVLDLVVLGDVGDEGFGIDPLTSLGAVAAPALVAKLMGARTPFALVGSTLGFGSGALFAKAFDKFGIFLAPALHAGATAVLSILGDQAR